MATVSTTIPDDLEQRVRSHLDASGEDFATFAARAFAEQLSVDDDPILNAELLRLSSKAKAEIDSGMGVDSIQAMRAIASSKGLRFDR